MVASVRPATASRPFASCCCTSRVSAMLDCSPTHGADRGQAGRSAGSGDRGGMGLLFSVHRRQLARAGFDRAALQGVGSNRANIWRDMGFLSSPLRKIVAQDFDLLRARPIIFFTSGFALISNSFIFGCCSAKTLKISSANDWPMDSTPRKSNNTFSKRSILDKRRLA